MQISELDGVELFPHRKPHLEAACAAAPKKGLIVEFGVWKGTSLRRMAEFFGPERTLLGFDSFRGLPEPWYTKKPDATTHPAGHFALRGLPEVPKNVILVVGWFNQTADLVLGGALAASQLPIALLHIDCDLFTSALEALDAATPGLWTGSIVVFDELGNWDGRYPLWEQGEWKALNLWLELHPELTLIPMSRTTAQQAAFRVFRA